MKNIKTFWTGEEYPHFLEKTDTQYHRAKVKHILKDRGLDNELLNQLMANLPKGAYIAGGFMNAVMMGNPGVASDVDIFFDGPEAFSKTYALLQDLAEVTFKEEENTSAKQLKKIVCEDFEEKKVPRLLCGYTTDIDQETLEKKSKELRFVQFKRKDKKGPPVQLVKLVWYESAEHCIDSFDFTVSQFAVSGKDLVYNPFGMFDLARKRLVLHRMQFPSATLRRTIKYTHKGFFACPGSLATIAASIHDALQDFPDSLLKEVYID